MSIAPVNFYSSFSLVPVFVWEPVEPTQDPTADTQPVAIGTGDVDSVPGLTPDADTQASTEMRLVFKGYEWRFTPGIATWPRPDWMDGITAGCNEGADPAKQEEEERKKRVDVAARAHAAALAHPRPDSAGSQDVGPAETDTSDSN
jgi:hypothetical protein